MSIAEQILRAKADYDAVYEAGYEKGKSEGGGDSGEIVGAYVSSNGYSFSCSLGFATAPKTQGDTSFGMCDYEHSDIGSFYSWVEPSDKYKIIFTRIDGYDYWQTFLFGLRDYSTLVEPATNENVLKHINIIDDNTYEITIPDGCYLFNVNFYNPMPCIIYKLN